MKASYGLLLLTVVGLLGQAAAGDVKVEEGVYFLDPTNFDSFLQEKEFALVAFKAPWCGHCKKLSPEWSKAALELEKDGLVLAEVDADEHRDLGSRFDVKGFPTIIPFRNGVQDGDYDGPRDATGIVQWMKMNAKPKAEEIDSVDEITKLIESGKPIVAGLFRTPLQASNMYKVFMESAKLSTLEEDLEEFVFIYSTSPDVASKLGTKAPRIIVKLPKAEEPSIFKKPKAELSAQSLIEFYKESK